ncbi:ribonuclease III family protein [Companilactobacillus tucceti DSM 20183]|uniref:Mini-ribonuclease 3 n=1 Tax=Companilactobacillus tucceti DSM 20183 TaxID=1423811 RepID=A0A0R1IZI9_9LACO|nr:ribonuclease III domain-containing protein [Companilactobacillus tucceti]KRK64408.1 ribonuclease III family protein [Companilactobacillus tucceti DSM 20183]
MVKIEQLNGVTLAYLGDAAYEVYIRRHLLDLNITKVNLLQQRAKHYVSAKAQAALINLMIEENVLSDEEIRIYKNGRNAKKYTKAKNTSVLTYHMSTGFEALIGYLDIKDDKKRLEELIAWCIKKVESGETDAEQFE